MSEGIYLDNDVVLKMCTYLAASELLQATTLGHVVPGVLGVAKFTLRTRVERSRTIRNRQAVREMLDKALSIMRLLEPDEEEVEAAADLEQRAIELGLEFD